MRQHYPSLRLKTMTFWEQYILHLEKSIKRLIVMAHCYFLGYLIGRWYETGRFAYLTIANWYHYPIVVTGLIIGLVISSAIQVYIDRKYDKEEED
jgi:uncharacterized membrane protein YraQ (UPF0718 family)